MSRETHMARAHRSHHNFRLASKDLAYHGKYLNEFSKNNKNKGRLPSWEDRFGKWENRDKKDS